MYQAVSFLCSSRFLLIFACTSTACSSFRGAMALDSVAEFAIRIEYVGLSEYMDKFDAMGATTLGMFAFAANYSPNSADDSAFIKEILVPILGSDLHPKKLALRRLFIEAYPMATAEMQRKSGPRLSEVPRQLPTSELELRRTRLEEQMPGFDFSGDHDPSNWLIDLAYTAIESKTLQHLRWEDFTSRRMVLDKFTTDRAWTTDASGRFKSSGSFVQHSGAQGVSS